MENYQKNMVGRFNDAKQTHGSTTQAYDDMVNLWNGYRSNYRSLAEAERKELSDDIDSVVTQINEAKNFAKELAATQISASSALATVSVHYRKKLQLWRRLVLVVGHPLLYLVQPLRPVTPP